MRFLYGLVASALLFIVWAARRGGGWTTAATVLAVLWGACMIGWLVAEFIVESVEGKP